MKRIGIFGGTFDPPHKGHIEIAEQAKKQLALDRVYFIPAFIPPHKLQHSSTTARHRWNMMKLAIGARTELRVSSIELRRRGISYTVDTLKAFKKRFPKATFVLIIGADNMLQFQSWKSPYTILRLASLAVYKRKGFHLPSNNSTLHFTILKGPILRISSTEIRKRIEGGDPVRPLVPQSVSQYIKRHVTLQDSNALFSEKAIP